MVTPTTTPTDTDAGSPEPGGRRPTADWVARLHSLTGVPTTDGNEVTVLRNGDEIFPAMISAIDDAEHSVDIVTFVYWTGDIAIRVAERLAAAARRGCRVRVLLDAVGARKMDTSLVDQMDAAGCDVRWFRPIGDGSVPDIGEVNHRTHRKVLVCDGVTGFTGGVGIADEWTGDAEHPGAWRDTHLRVRGPAVAGLAAAFIDNWAEAAADEFDAQHEQPVDLTASPGSTSCMVVPGSSGPGSTAIDRLIVALIQLARQRLRLQTAYFNPTEAVIGALIDAVDRGVEVQVMVPGEHADKRFVQLNGEGSYQRLLDAGVDLRTYERTMLHAKVVSVDGQLAAIGSANLNRRSLDLDEECDLVMFDDDVVSVIDRHFDDDLQHCVELDPERWAQRTLLQRLGERVTGWFDRWL